MKTKICLLLIFGFLSCVFSKAEAAITWTTDNFDYNATDAAGYYYNWMVGVVCLNASSDKSTANKNAENTDVATAVEPQPGSWSGTPGLSMISAAWGNATQDLTKDTGGASVYAYANSACQLDDGPGVLMNGQNVSSYIDRYFQVDADKAYTLSASALAPVSWSGTVSGTATAPQPALAGWVKLLQTDQTTGATTAVQSFSLSDLLSSSRQASVSLVKGNLYQLVVSLSNVSDLGGVIPPAGIVTAFNNIDYSGGGSLGNIDGAFNAGTQENPVTITASLAPASDPPPPPMPALMQGATSTGNGWYSSWLGAFAPMSTTAADWIYHQTLGWLYPVGTAPGNLWFYDPQWDGSGGWWWTANSVYPWIYSVTENTWYYYDAAAKGGRWFFNGSGASTH